MKIRWIISAVLIAVAVVGISFADTWMKDTGYEINGTTLDFDIWQQLHNIGATTISATQWGYLGGQDQAVSTSDAPTFATINTGQGDNELYDMNQNVQTTDAPTFAGLTLTDEITGLNYTINANSLQEGLVGFWGFEYGSGGTAYDSSREGNDGTLTNMDNSTSWVAGKDGTALEFDGVDDYVNLNKDFFNGSSNLTLSLWFKDESDSSTTNRGLVGFGDSADRQLWIFEGDAGSRTLAIHLENTTGTRITSYVIYGDTNWHHLVVTYDGSYVKGYLDNGAPVTQALTGGLIDNSGISYLGQILGFNYWDGSIDDVRIYNRALTAEEIRALYYGLGSQPTGHLSLK